ncbi:TPA: hypothetical protein ACKP8G_003944 [Serratia marcescens]
MNVQRAIRDGLGYQQKRHGAELDEIVHQLVSIARADATFTFSQSGTDEYWAGFGGVMVNRVTATRAGKSGYAR